MRKILLTLITLASFASADYFYQPKNMCVKSYWFTPSNGRLNYIPSHVLSAPIMYEGLSSSVNYQFTDGYEYNVTTGRCQKVASNNSLGLANDDYTYFMALTGLICGSLIVVGAFMGLRISA